MNYMADAVPFIVTLACSVKVNFYFSNVTTESQNKQTLIQRQMIN